MGSSSPPGSCALPSGKRTRYTARVRFSCGSTAKDNPGIIKVAWHFDPRLPEVPLDNTTRYRRNELAQAQVEVQIMTSMSQFGWVMFISDLNVGLVVDSKVVRHEPATVLLSKILLVMDHLTIRDPTL